MESPLDCSLLFACSRDSSIECGYSLLHYEAIVTVGMFIVTVGMFIVTVGMFIVTVGMFIVTVGMFIVTVGMFEILSAGEHNPVILPAHKFWSHQSNFRKI